MGIYKKVEEFMVDQKITPYRLCKDCGIAASTITAWKQGKAEPSVASLVKICKTYKKSITYFLEETVVA